MITRENQNVPRCVLIWFLRASASSIITYNSEHFKTLFSQRDQQKRQNTSFISYYLFCNVVKLTRQENTTKYITCCFQWNEILRKIKQNVKQTIVVRWVATGMAALSKLRHACQFAAAAAAIFSICNSIC